MGGCCCAAAQATDAEREEAKRKLEAKGDKLPVGDFVINEDRRITDILFLLFYIIFFAGMIVVGIIGFINGDPQRLSAGYDFNGNVCGQGNFSDKQYLYYPFPWLNASTGTPDLSWSVCVKSCPLNMKMPPDMCTIPFQVVYSSKTISCGGNADGSTNMNQFSALDQIKFDGYTKACLQQLPVCVCQGGSNSSVGPQCCNGLNKQLVIGGVPQTVPNSAPASSFFGIPIGYKYGFCFFSYPSTSVKGLSRCVPYPGNTLVGSTNSSTASTVLASIASNDTSAKPNADTFDQGFQSVLKAASNPQESFTSLVNELYTNIWVIIGSAGMALLIALVYTQLLRVTVRLMTYSVLLFLWLLLCAATVIIAVKAGYIKSNQLPVGVGGAISSISLPAGTTFGQAETNQNLTSIAAAVVGTTFLLYNVLLCVFISRINVAISVIETAGDCIRAMPLALIFPIAQWFALLVLFVWFVAVFLFLASAGTWDQTTHSFLWNDQIRRALIYHCFGLLWSRAFILAVGNLIIAGAAAQWYISGDKSFLSSPMLSSAKRTIRYHLGTAAFGSFIIAVVQFIRWVFRYYVYQVKKLDPNNKLVQFLAFIGECCLACLERFLNFINRNAYIQTAIEATSFCTSAVAAFNLLMRNFLRLGALTIVASVYLNIGKLVIAGTTGFICALIMVGGSLNNISQAPLFSTTVILLLSFAVGSAFMDVWEMVIDTLFQCYCIDVEKGGTGEPKKGSPALTEFVTNNKPSNEDVKVMASSIKGSSSGQSHVVSA